MGHEKQIEDFILRKRKYWRTAQQNETKNYIIELLKEKPRSIRTIQNAPAFKARYQISH